MLFVMMPFLGGPTYTEGFLLKIYLADIYLLDSRDNDQIAPLEDIP
jgi:hypothetical protein